MKIPSVCSLILIAVGALAGERIGRESIKSYTVQQLKVKGHMCRGGEIISIHFSYRSNEMTETEPNWFHCNIWRYDPSSTMSQAVIDAEVPQSELTWFEQIPTDYMNARETAVYAKVIKHHGSIWVRFVGRQIVRDINGNGEITW